jgi:hypothetical protein
MTKKVKQLLDEILPTEKTDLVIQAGKLVKLVTKGPCGNADEDALIAKIFEIGLHVVKMELCKRCKPNADSTRR